MILRGVHIPEDASGQPALSPELQQRGWFFSDLEIVKMVGALKSLLHIIDFEFEEEDIESDRKTLKDFADRVIEIMRKSESEGRGLENWKVLGGFYCEEIDKAYLSHPLTGADFIFNRYGSKTVYMRFRGFGQIPKTSDYLSFDIKNGSRVLRGAWAFYLARYEHGIGLCRFNGFVEFCLSLLSRGLITGYEYDRLVPNAQGLEECRRIIIDRINGKETGVVS